MSDSREVGENGHRGSLPGDDRGRMVARAVDDFSPPPADSATCLPPVSQRRDEDGQPDQAGRGAERGEGEGNEAEVDLDEKSSTTPRGGSGR